MIPRASILGARPEYLLEWDIAGHVVRVATSSVTVTDRLGRSLLFQAGLDEPRASGPVEECAVSFLPPEDMAKLRARGIPLVHTSARLYRWYAGQTLDAALVVCTGLVDDVAYGTLQDPVQITIVSRAVGASKLAYYPPPDLAFNSSTWPSGSPYSRNYELDGVPYPTVIGYPGSLPANFDAQPATPAYMADYVDWQTDAYGYWKESFLVIAGHRVEANEVVVFDLSESPDNGTLSGLQGYDVSVEHRTDNLGNPVAGVSFLNLSELRPDITHEYAVAWSGSTTLTDPEGGLRNDDGTVMRGLGDVLVWALVQSRAAPVYEVDVEAQVAQRSLLNAYYVDTCIAEPTNLLEWVDRNLALVFPIRRRTGRHGIYYEADRLAIGDTRVVAVLDADSGRVTRLGPVRSAEPTRGIANEITIRYARTVAGRYVGQVIVTGDLPESAPWWSTLSSLSTKFPNLLCKHSQSLLAARGGDGIVRDTIETDVIWDPATAQLCAQAMARRRALPVERVAYVGGRELESVELGGYVLVSDSAVHLSQRGGWVEEIRVDGDRVSVLVELDSDPDRIVRRTS